MKTVLTLVCIISAAHYVTADCSLLKTFTTELQPNCSANDIYIKFPNYANQSTYYSCLQVGKAQVVPCPAGYYFIYVMQQCGPCASYIPPVPCEQLKTQNPPICVAIGSSNSSTTIASSTGTSNYPTPVYPSTSQSTTATATATTATTTNSRRTTTTAVTPPTVTVTTAATTVTTSIPRTS
ncbi:PREDICTED: peritrophin-55-like [Rhagoletis zephyria]|uniref:peritrophin-55-like n=1 Tax=Rhagoletis zephyria TaxID=28612 RepID=UPI000811A208|nr:PREDICTED: peritrophin-55-like [Rhagoletis zephyria]